MTGLVKQTLAIFEETHVLEDRAGQTIISHFEEKDVKEDSSGQTVTNYFQGNRRHCRQGWSNNYWPFLRKKTSS